jgi:hypothetical protein
MTTTITARIYDTAGDHWVGMPEARPGEQPGQYLRRMVRYAVRR